MHVSLSQSGQDRLLSVMEMHAFFTLTLQSLLLAELKLAS